MSRTRIVKGKITEIVGGDYNIYSTASIVTNSAEEVIQIGAEKGVTYGSNPRHAKGVDLPAKCVVDFRPKENWKGEDYGFDWMRMGETTVSGDHIPYEDIVAEQYKDLAYTQLEDDPNETDGHFKTSSRLFALLRNEYGHFSIPWKKNPDGTPKEYYCSWLSLYPKEDNTDSSHTTAEPTPPRPNTKALLSLIVEVKTEPITLKFKENPHFKISPMEITKKSKGRHHLKDYVTIECLQEFSTDQAIEVYATSKNPEGNEIEQLAGKLNVWANDASKRKKAKVVLVEIKTPEISTIGVKNEGSSLAQKELFEKYLRHALIEIDVETYSLDLSSDDNLKAGGKYVDASKILAYYEDPRLIPPQHRAGYQNLIFYLNAKLKDDLKLKNETEDKYSRYFVAFYLGEKGCSKLENGNNKSLAGYALGNFVVLFSDKNDQTAAHEFLHTKGLAHSFTNKVADENAKYTYIYNVTNNIMDYSFNRYCLWKWQWEIANSKTVEL